MTPAELEQFDCAAASGVFRPLLIGKTGGEISFIDDEDEDGDSIERLPPSPSSTSPSRPPPNGPISPLTIRRTVSLLPTLSRPIEKRARKTTVFKISLATVADDGIKYANRRKRPWLQPNLTKFAVENNYLRTKSSLVERNLVDTNGEPRMISKLQKTTKFWPYEIWRDKFLREHNCWKEELCREVFLSALPHFVVLLVVSIYILLGSLIFRRLDEQLDKLPFHDVLLFTFTTITTIGYGNIAPRTPQARLACVAYCLVGIPLVFLPLSNLGEVLAEFYWIGIASMKGQKDDGHFFHRGGANRLPLKVVVLLILFHSLLGGLIFHFWIQRMPIFPAIYFSFISITTIGFGDLFPEPQNLFETMVIIVYLSAGIAIMSTLFNTLGDHLRRIHYLGRDFEGAPDVRVWFGGQPLTVRELVALVANRFEIPAERLREVLAELDALIRLSDHGTHATRSRHFWQNAEQKMDEQLQPPSPTSSINSEQQQMLQALSTLHRLTVKGTRTFHTPSLNSLSLLIRSSPNHNQNISSSPLIMYQFLTNCGRLAMSNKFTKFTQKRINRQMVAFLMSIISVQNG
uniref:Potassium channel domain-containing protein n=3 Tax=Globodera rostochiensis TaxID=31243 RepID=A0A914GV86_GLORO